MAIEIVGIVIEDDPILFYAPSSHPLRILGIVSHQDAARVVLHGNRVGEGINRLKPFGRRPRILMETGFHKTVNCIGCRNRG